ncbi:MAG: winged helix-turn-helix domain-containing protein [Pirellulales bacterium]
MAKKKPAAESRASVSSAKTTTKKSLPAKTPGLSNDLIGDTAGKIWHALAAGPLTLAALKKEIGAPDELVLTSLGWLAREGKLSFDSSGRSVTVSLR